MQTLVITVALLSLVAAHHDSYVTKSFLDHKDCKDKDIGGECIEPPGMEKVCCRKSEHGITYCRFNCIGNASHVYDLICTRTHEAFPLHCDICNDGGERLAYYLNGRSLSVHKPCRNSATMNDYCGKFCGDISRGTWKCSFLKQRPDQLECRECLAHCEKMCRANHFFNFIHKCQ